LEERDTLFGQAVTAAALTRGGFIPGGNTEGKEFNVYANGSKLARATAHYNAAMAARWERFLIFAATLVFFTPKIISSLCLLFDIFVTQSVSKYFPLPIYFSSFISLQFFLDFLILYLLLSASFFFRVRASWRRDENIEQKGKERRWEGEKREENRSNCELYLATNTTPAGPSLSFRESGQGRVQDPYMPFEPDGHSIATPLHRSLCQPFAQLNGPYSRLILVRWCESE
jgi:hypothetical protein